MGPPSRALQTRARETTTTKRDASWRLVVVSFPATFHPPPPSANYHGPAVSRALSRCTRNGNDETRRHRPPRARCLAQLRARHLARCKPMHARRRQRDETPAGVSSSSLSPPPPPHTAATLSTPPRARRLAHCKPVHARRRQRDETPAGVSSLSLPPAAPAFLHPQHPPRARRLARAATPCT
ncbi:hypothetical protein PLICRDRAFT_175068 [Plicaturopsis crispa FD-325 SS-3]|nr:hypothetical protein PLICRDRAFT_175068 [Plicaturopsis crispa FD-325 SS-3]